jgi:hypothetical protein
MPRPATNRAVVEEIARAYEKFDRQELINILSYLTKTYVVDGTMPFNLVGEKAGQVGDVAGAEKDLDFPKLIDQLKRRLPHMPELGYFQVESGKVTMRAANQKVTFGERGPTSEFVPTSSAPPPAAAPAAKAAGAVAAASKAAGGAKPPADKPASLSDTQQEALNDIVTRFKNLELD